MEKAGISPPVHSSASGSSPPSLMSQSRAGFVEPAAPGKVVAGAEPGGWSWGPTEGRASGPGSTGAGGRAAASEGGGCEASRSSGVARGPKAEGPGTVGPGVLWGLEGAGVGSLGRGDSVGAEAGVGSVPAHGTQGLSGEGLAPGGTLEAMEGVSTGRVSGVGVTMAWGTVGGKEVGASRAGGAGERSGLWRGRQRGTGRDRKGHSAGRRGSRRQAGKGYVKRKGDQGEERQKQPINSPEGMGGGRGQALGHLCQGGAQCPDLSCLSATNSLSRNRWDADSHPPGSRSHTAAQVLVTEHLGRQTHRAQATRETLTTGTPMPHPALPPGPSKAMGSPVGRPLWARHHTRPCVCRGAARHTSYTPSGCSRRPGTCTEHSHGGMGAPRGSPGLGGAPGVGVRNSRC